MPGVGGRKKKRPPLRLLFNYNIIISKQDVPYSAHFLQYKMTPRLHLSPTPLRDAVVSMGINFCPAYVDFPRFSGRVLRVQWAPGATIMLNTGLCRAKANEARAATKKVAQKNQECYTQNFTAAG